MNTKAICHCAQDMQNATACTLLHFNKSPFPDKETDAIFDRKWHHLLVCGEASVCVHVCLCVNRIREVCISEEP